VRLLVTRPEPECERTATALRARGHEVLVLPLLRIEAVADADLGAGPWAALIFTSANAVRAVAQHRRFGELAGLPAYVVGGRTRIAAAAAGFAEVRSADGDVGDLVRLTVAQPPAAGLPLLYLAGRDRSGDVAGALGGHGLQVETVVIYGAVMETNLAPPVRAALAAGEIDGVLHFSARTVAAFVAVASAAQLDQPAMKARHFCLSAAVAAPLIAAGASAIEVAATPNEQALFDRIGTA
jgi:uroporphyrinogen-III synthase